MSIRQKITAFVFTCILLVPVAGSLFLQIKISVIQNEMTQRLKKEPLLTLHIPANKIRWAKPGKELLYENRLFDVKKISINDDNTAVVTGLFDDDEKKLADHVAREQEQNKPLTQLLVQLFATGYDHSFSTQPVLLIPMVIPEKKGTPVILAYHSPYTSVAAPPPWHNC
jgi:hypothetical protein